MVAEPVGSATFVHGACVEHGSGTGGFRYHGFLAVSGAVASFFREHGHVVTLPSSAVFNHIIEKTCSSGDITFVGSLQSLTW